MLCICTLIVCHPDFAHIHVPVRNVGSDAEHIHESPVKSLDSEAVQLVLSLSLDLPTDIIFIEVAHCESARKVS